MKRKKITQTLRPLFAMQGYGVAPTGRIALEAGIKKPLIFYLFNRKGGLFTPIPVPFFEDRFGGSAGLKMEPASALFHSGRMRCQWRVKSPRLCAQKPISVGQPQRLNANGCKMVRDVRTYYGKRPENRPVVSHPVTVW